MCSRLSLEEKIQIVLLYGKFGNFQEIIRQWKNQFTTRPPHEETIRNVVNKFKETGSVHDRERSGRSRSVVTPEVVQNVKKKVEENSNLSIRKGAIEMGMNISSYYRAVKETGFHSFKPSQVIALSEDDFDKRIQFCETMLQIFEENNDFVNKIIWSDESEFKLNGVVNRHNCCYWSYSNPHEEISVINSKKGVMVWCGVTSDGLIGPYFFEGSVNSMTYLQMLNEFLWPQVKYQRKFFQQDGASPHYSLDVRSWLDQKFPNRWIGRRGPIEWPARSPDLSPPDFFLWGYLKDIVYKSTPSTENVLRDRIKQACKEIDPGMCKRACENVVVRLKRCLESNGQHVD
jgi:transposase